jgi:hypothetical protein
MGVKRPVGVVVIGAVNILIGLCFLGLMIPCLGLIFEALKYWPDMYIIALGVGMFTLVLVVFFLLSKNFIKLGIATLRLALGVRVENIKAAFFELLIFWPLWVSYFTFSRHREVAFFDSTLVKIAPAAYSLWVIIYLTAWPRIKELFKKKK